MNRYSWLGFVALVLPLLAMTAGCKPPQAAPPPAVPEVAVVTVQPTRVLLTSELPGRTSSYRVAEIRPQVNGLLLKRHFTEGSQVKQGDLLYEIDPAPYEAALNNASASLLAMKEGAERARAALGASIASLKRHESILGLTKANLARYENLVVTNAISVMERDKAASDVEVADAGLRTAQAQIEVDRQGVEAAEAGIQQAEAALQTAKINLAYTKITAPIPGRIGRSEVTEGAIVTAYQPVPLATIHQLHPIFVDVRQSTAELNRLKRSLSNGRLKNNGTADRVKIVMEDGTAYPHEGSLQFRDVTVDPTTGSIVLRIEVPNPDGILLPNLFVRAVVEEGVNDRAILLPQQAVSRDPKGNPLAWIVDDKGKPQPRPLRTDRAIGDRWLVSSGLAQGDRVIVEGIQKALMSRAQNPDTTVKAVPFQAGGVSAAKPEGTAQTSLR